MVGRSGLPEAAGLAIDLAVPPGPAASTIRSRHASWCQERTFVRTAYRAARFMVPGGFVEEAAIKCRRRGPRCQDRHFEFSSSDGRDRIVDADARRSSRTRVRQYSAKARQAGDVLAVLVEKGTAPGLYFVSLSRAVVLGTDYHPSDEFGTSVFALSRDGQRFARLIDDRRLDAARRAGVSSAGVGYAGGRIVDAFCDARAVMPVGPRVRRDRPEACLLMLPDSLGPWVA